MDDTPPTERDRVPPERPDTTRTALDALRRSARSGSQSWSLREWITDNDLLTGRTVAVGAIAFIVVVLVAVMILTLRFRPVPENIDALREPDALLPTQPPAARAGRETPTPVSTPGAGSLFEARRPSTPAAEPTPGVPVFREGRPEPSPETRPTPWITATPQNRTLAEPPQSSSEGPVVILNPGPGRRSGAEGTSPRPGPVPEAPPPTPPPPRLTVSSSSLSFAAGESSKVVTLSNQGSGAITWQVTPQQTWIVAAPTAGAFSDSGTLQVWVNREIVRRGERSGTLVLTSDAGTVTITVTID